MQINTFIRQITKQDAKILLSKVVYMKNIAVVLSGCGYLDGSEITEVVSLMIELDRSGCSYTFYAPNTNYPSTQHSDQPFLGGGVRNALEESARITRGQIKNLNELQTEDYDGFALPGGFGAAKNLSTWATDGALCTVNKDLEKTILSFHKESKPILAICIAPALIARVLGKDFTPCVSLGDDQKNSGEIEKTGAEHVDCLVTDFVTDRENKIISTPAYMCNASPYEVFTGISRACSEFIEMC